MIKEIPVQDGFDAPIREHHLHDIREKMSIKTRWMQFKNTLFAALSLFTSDYTMVIKPRKQRNKDESGVYVVCNMTQPDLKNSIDALIDLYKNADKLIKVKLADKVENNNLPNDTD